MFKDSVATGSIRHPDAALFGSLEVRNPIGAAPVTLVDMRPMSLSQSLSILGVGVLRPTENPGIPDAACDTWPLSWLRMHRLDGFVLGPGQSVYLLVAVGTEQRKLGELRGLTVTYRVGDGEPISVDLPNIHYRIQQLESPCPEEL